MITKTRSNAIKKENVDQQDTFFFSSEADGKRTRDGAGHGIRVEADKSERRDVDDPRRELAKVVQGQIEEPVFFFFWNVSWRMRE